MSAVEKNIKREDVWGLVQKFKRRDEDDEAECRKEFTSRFINEFLDMDMFDENLDLNARCLDLSYPQSTEIS